MYVNFLFSRDFDWFEDGLSIIVLKGKLESVYTSSHFKPHIYETGKDWRKILDKGIYTVLTLSFNYFRPGMPSNHVAF